MRSLFPDKLDLETDRYQNKNRKKLLGLMDSMGFKEDIVHTFSDSPLGKYLLFLKNQTSMDGIFKNISIIFFNGEIMTTYNKSTYYQEQDDLLYSYIYEFGKGQDNNSNNKNINNNAVHSNISTQICRDLFAGIRVEDTENKRFHILQSNTINFISESIPINAQYVIHVNHGTLGVIYKKTKQFSSIPDEKKYVWNPIGPFNFHLKFEIGSSTYTLQQLNIPPI